MSKRLMLRVPQAAEFCGKGVDEIKAAIKSGELGTRNVDGVAGPHVHGDELVRWAGMSRDAAMAVFGFLPDAKDADRAKPDA